MSDLVITTSGLTRRLIAINSGWGSFYPRALAGGIVNALNKREPFRLAESLLGSVGGVAATALGC